MKRKLGDVVVPERPVRWLGGGLLVAGLVLPFAALYLQAANWQPPRWTVEEAPALRPEMVILRPGTFMMGSPEDEEGRDDDETLHQVTLTRPFAISRTEVTQGQYAAVTGERPVNERTDFGDFGCSEAGVDDDFPVVCVSWREAVEYCNALSEREGLDRAYDIQGDQVIWNRQVTGYRLPTEAEWEYAARAGARHTWVGTDRREEVCKFANVADLTAKKKYPQLEIFECDDTFGGLSPVSNRQENRWRLWGLGGNAAEWVWDGYGPYSGDPVEDPAVDRASGRVIRGGSGWTSPRLARVAYRRRYDPSSRGVSVGFRVARSLPSAL